MSLFAALAVVPCFAACFIGFIELRSSFSSDSNL